MTTPRKGIHPVSNLWTYLRVQRMARSRSCVAALKGERGWTRECAFGDKYYPFNWAREVPADQRRVYFRLDHAHLNPDDNDVADLGRVARRVYIVLDHANRDSGVRVAWCRLDSLSMGGSHDEVLGVNLMTKQVYSPPREKQYCWIDPVWAAVYALNDTEGWRNWSEADDAIVKERGAKQ